MKIQKEQKMNIASRLKLAREESRMTQEELGKKIGMTKLTIQRYEKDAQGLTVKALMRIAEETNTEAMWIMYGDAMEVNMGTKMAEMVSRLNTYDDELKKEVINIAEALMLKKHAEKIAS